MGFLKTLLIILLVYYLLKILARWFAPKLFSFAVKRTEKHFNEQFGNFQSTVEEERSEGDISIDKGPTKKNKTSKDIGEYIDFEEIE